MDTPAPNALFIGPDHDPNRFEVRDLLGGGTEGQVRLAVARNAVEHGDRLDWVAVKIFRETVTVPTATTDNGAVVDARVVDVAHATENHAGGLHGDDDDTEILAATQPATQPATHPRTQTAAQDGPAPTQELPPPTPEEIEEARRDAEAQWTRRILMLSGIRDPGLVGFREGFTGAEMHRAHETPTDRRYRYVVMDYIPGQHLAEWVATNPDAPLADRVHVLRAVAAALDTLHRADPDNGTVPLPHGDVKPGNIVVPDGGTQGILVDLGAMRMPDGLTRMTYPYTAPEVLKARTPAEAVTPQADTFAFFATLFEVLTGQTPPTVPVTGLPDVEEMERVMRSDPDLRSRPDLVSRVLAGLSDNPAERPTRLLEALNGLTSTVSTQDRNRLGGPVPAPGHRPRDEAHDAAAPVDEPRRRAWLVPVAAVAALLLVGGGAAWAVASGGIRIGDAEAADAAATVATSPEPSPETSAEPSPEPSADATPEPSDTPSVESSPEPEPVAMPDLAGLDWAGGAAQELRELGLDSPDVEQVVSFDAAPGLVTSQTPAAGTPVAPGDTVTVTLAKAPFEQFLVDREAVSLAFNDGPVGLDGVVYPRSLVAPWYVGRTDSEPEVSTWNLSRAFDRLTTTVGLGDDSEATDAGVRMRILGDDELLYEGDLVVGAPEVLDLDVAGVLRLDVQVQVIRESDSRRDVVVVVGDPVLLSTEPPPPPIED